MTDLEKKNRTQVHGRVFAQQQRGQIQADLTAIDHHYRIDWRWQYRSNDHESRSRCTTIG